MSRQRSLRLGHARTVALGVPAPLPVPAEVSPPSALGEKQADGSAGVVFEEIG